jgi:CRISPR-associated protein Cas1
VITTRSEAGEESTDWVVAADIALILLGTGVRFSSGVLHRLAEHDVVMMMCDWRGVPQAVSLPWSEHSRIGARQAAQAQLSPEVNAQAWAAIVRAKILGQAATLAVWKPRLGTKLVLRTEGVEPGDPGNVEAVAAKTYFPDLFGADFVRDTDGGDRLNAMLNYGYGILRGVGVRAVLAAGLVPSLGVWHRHRANPFNLVADLMEPFRPVVDHAVRALPPYSSLKKVETKKLLAAAVEAQVAPGRGVVTDEFATLAQRYGQLAQGEIEVLPVPVWAPGGEGRP